MRLNRNSSLAFFVVGVFALGLLESFAEATPPGPPPAAAVEDAAPSGTPEGNGPRVATGPTGARARAELPKLRSGNPRVEELPPQQIGPAVSVARGAYGAPDQAAPERFAAIASTPLAGNMPASATGRIPMLNQAIIDLLRTMPQGGGYKAGGDAFTQLKRSVALDPAGHLAVRAQLAKPSFCSGATFLVFLGVIEQLEREGRLSLSPEAGRALLVHGQPDGVGVWGRWNANGPGTARFFFESGLGRNFTSFEEARPGDFMKVWWNENIGSTEHGHSVIYLGTSVNEKGVSQVSFWSSNVPGGFGFRTVPKPSIKRALFSRLENVGAINRVTALPASDLYLAAMLKRPSSEAEMFPLVGIEGRSRETRGR